MSDSEVLYSKVYNKDKTRLFRLKTEWDENYFNLFIIDGSDAWFALVTKEHIDKLAGQHDIDPDVYLKNLWEYICNEQPSITFDIVNKQFIIYRTIEKAKSRFKYFLVNLEKLNYQETMEIFLDELVAKQTDSQKRLKALEEQKLEADSQKLLYEKKCEEFVDLKRKADLQMYSAFLQILNEKKHRIRFLTEQLEEYNTGRKSKVNTVATTSKQQPEKRKLLKPTVEEKPKETISESDSNHSDGYNTDDEKKPRIFKEIEAIPGTSRDNLDFLGGDSPPPILPKRFKKEETNTCPISSSTADTSRKVQANGAKEDITDTNQENSDESSQSLNFDTQELLDRM